MIPIVPSAVHVIYWLIQHERVSLPPALIISMQLLMGTLFGVCGLALAMVISALGLTLVREAYVDRSSESKRGKTMPQCS